VISGPGKVKRSAESHLGGGRKKEKKSDIHSCRFKIGGGRREEEKIAKADIVAGAK